MQCDRHPEREFVLVAVDHVNTASTEEAAVGWRREDDRHARPDLEADEGRYGDGDPLPD
jgi:hypothetical protein